MAAFLADENFEDEVVQALVGFGHDVVTARSVGLNRQSDRAVLAAATVDGRIVLTHDRDFQKLHKSGVAHSGIVFASIDTNFTALANRIHVAVSAIVSITGQFIRVTRPNVPHGPDGGV
jgi:hypothetical protein